MGRWIPKQPRSFAADFARGGAAACSVVGPLMAALGLLAWRPLLIIMGYVTFAVGVVILVLDSEVTDA